jgi:uncharacterized membrane protein
MSRSTRHDEIEARYEARREAVWVVLIAVVVLLLMALASRREGWHLVDLGWWVWLVLAIPGLLLCLDIWLGAGGVRVVRTRKAAVVVLGLIVLGNVVGLVLLIAALVTTSSDELGGGQLLLTAAAIWIANVIVFGIVFWDVDGGGPFERARHDRSRRDFQFPQDETPELGWKPRVWDYLYVSLTAGTAFSPTDTMPLTLIAKLLHAVQSTVSLVLVVLVTARAVNVLGA